MPNLRFSGGWWSMRSPSIHTSPSVAGSSPATMFSAVDLPQPLGPRKVMNCRPRASSAKSRSTVFAPNRLVMRNRSESSVSFKLSLDLLRADLPVPAVHRVRELLEVELGGHLVLLAGADLVVIGAPELLHVVADLGRRLVERRRLDARTDERLVGEDLLVDAAH